MDNGWQTKRDEGTFLQGCVVFVSIMGGFTLLCYGIIFIASLFEPSKEEIAAEKKKQELEEQRSAEVMDEIYKKAEERNAPIRKKMFDYFDEIPASHWNVNDFMTDEFERLTAIDGEYDPDRHDELVTNAAARKFGMSTEEIDQIWYDIEAVALVNAANKFGIPSKNAKENYRKHRQSKP